MIVAKGKTSEETKTRNNKPPSERSLQEREMAKLSWMIVIDFLNWENACTLFGSMRTRFIEKSTPLSKLVSPDTRRGSWLKPYMRRRGRSDFIQNVGDAAAQSSSEKTARRSLLCEHVRAHAHKKKKFISLNGVVLLY